MYVWKIALAASHLVAGRPIGCMQHADFSPNCVVNVPKQMKHSRCKSCKSGKPTCRCMVLTKSGINYNVKVCALHAAPWSVSCVPWAFKECVVAKSTHHTI